MPVLECFAKFGDAGLLSPVGRRRPVGVARRRQSGPLPSWYVAAVIHPYNRCYGTPAGPISPVFMGWFDRGSATLMT